MWDEFGNETLATDNSSTTWDPPVSSTDIGSVMDSQTRGGSDSGWGTWSQGAMDKLLGTWANIKQAETVGQVYRGQTQIDPRTGRPYVSQRYAGGVGVGNGGITLNTNSIMFIAMGVMAFMLMSKKG